MRLSFRSSDRSQPQGKSKSVVDALNLARVQASRRASQTLGIYNRRLLDQHARSGAVQGDDRPKARWPRALVELGETSTVLNASNSSA